MINRRGSSPLPSTILFHTASCWFPALAVFAFLSFFYNGGTAATLNLAAAIYNLLPYRQLDGGAAIALFTEGSVFQQTAELVLLAIRIVISVVLFIAFLIVGVKALPLFVVSLMLLVASYTGCNS